MTQSFVPIIVLPATTPCETNLQTTLTRRRSVRDFHPQIYTKQEISNIIDLAIGPKQTRSSDVVTTDHTNLRPYPTAGAIAAVEHYIFCNKFSDLDTGFYHYQSIDRILSTIPKFGIGNLEDSINAPPELLKNCGFIVVQTIVPSRLVKKYQNRGYRFAIIESGLAAQSICLAATSRGFGTLLWGGFYDNEINKLLQIDGVNETAINIIIVGTPSKAFSTEI